MTSLSNTIKKIIPKTQPIEGWTQQHFAPVNIALIKYWGKRNIALNLPVTDSLSIGLNQIGTRTSIRVINDQYDQIILNGQPLTKDEKFYQRITQYLDLFRQNKNMRFEVNTRNDVPTGAGLASSASGYGALILALNELFQWQLNIEQLSILARIGSGSASRSLWQGLVHWQAGSRDDGMDSYAKPIAQKIPDMRIGLLTLSSHSKAISSRDGMQRTQQGLSLYPAWSAMVATHLTQIQTAIADQNIQQIGEIAEHNALAMHASMMSAWPALCYWLPETLQGLQTLWSARNDGLACWATLDAGPNIKLIFDQKVSSEVSALFPTLQIISPFE